jgi:formamidopyrimidine-DNA glycosylase
MPELPEVETMVRGIRPFVEGRTIKAVVRCPCPSKPISIRPRFQLLAKRLAGQRIDTVRRLGKRVVLGISDGSSVVIEPRMTGLMLLSNPPDSAHLRIEWKFAGRAKYNSVWFWDQRGLGVVRLFEPGELEQALSSEVLGPDALAMDADTWRVRLRKTSRPIKVVLLDQKVVAGIGNLYASEILHLAKIHPARPARRLKPDEIRRVDAATRSVLEEAILHEGSTLGDATYRTALNQNGQYQAKHRAYGRAGETCLTCSRAKIVRIVQAQRSTFYCPHCQRR